jgi:pyridoxamine 5'-phosphate oxidase
MPLDENNLPPNPLDLFKLWLREAETSDNPLPNAMALATATASGLPSNRFVLLKGIDDRGIVFFSNYESLKGMELAENPRAAAAIFWPHPRRQVRVEGEVERIALAESDAYFRTRDRLSQIGATISPQSKPITGKAGLDQQVAELNASLGEHEVTRPAHWGGYRIIPDAIEFWIGGENRLHDRLRYHRKEDRPWKVERLAP